MSDINEDFEVEETEEELTENSYSFDELSDKVDELGNLDIAKCAELLSEAAVLADNAEDDDFVYVNLTGVIATAGGTISFKVNTIPKSKLAAVKDAVKGLFSK